jgi:two-component system CheB/CheR fusion protein
MNQSLNQGPKAVVGVGASAGGLAPLKDFFADFPDDAGLALLVVQHLAPDHSSRLAEILGKVCNLLVKEAEDGEPIRANVVYTIPPNAALVVENGCVRLRALPSKEVGRSAVDILFRSIAECYRTEAIGIIFSGAGTDGTAGLRSIVAAGGLTLAQIPETASHSGMPRSAIDAGVVDEVLSVQGLREFLLRYAARFRPLSSDGMVSPTERDEDEVREVITLLKSREHFDLDHYKVTTVRRRIARRINLTSSVGMEAYLKLLAADAEERQALMRDLLINVTEFFRDPEAFAELNRLAIQPIVEQAMEGEEIRVWVAGCSTGEEAYSLGISFHEAMEAAGSHQALRIFATDVDEEAIVAARRGIYPANLFGAVEADLLEKYFRPMGTDQFQVRERLRDSISFATQNIYADPPFSRLDLVSCRNVLIYLRPETQERILRSFGFALKASGILFLGSSESVGKQKAFFRSLSEKWRIFERNPREGRTKGGFDLPSLPHSHPRERRHHAGRGEKGASGVSSSISTLLSLVPPSVVVDGDNQICYLHGELGKLLRVPSGEPRMDLMSTLHPELRSRVRGAVFKARSSGEKVVVHPPRCFMEEFPEMKDLQILVQCDESPRAGDGSMVVSFQQRPDTIRAITASTVTEEEDRMIETLERELAETREELENLTDELETNSEELRTSHEEALSTNEELQSANEELEASTEELRSLNEELMTVNGQLKEKIDELQTANDYQSNLFASTNVATLFLDAELRVRRFTPAAERLLQMDVADVGKPLRECSHILLGKKVADEAETVMATLEPSENEISIAPNRWFTRKVLPFRTQDRRIDGVVVTYHEISSLKSAMWELERSEERHAIIARLGLAALGGRPLGGLQDEVVREVAHTLKVDFVKILQYFPEREDLLLRAGVGWKQGLVGTARVPAEAASQAGYTLMARHPVIVEDFAEERRFEAPALLRDHAVVSGVSCVIANGGHPYGVLAVHARSPRAFSSEEATFLTSVANLLSVAIHREEAEAAVKSSRDRLDLARSAAQIGIHDHNLRTNTVTWDSVIREIWGIPADLEPITYELFEEGLHPEDRGPTKAAIERAMRQPEGSFLRVEYRVINRRTGRQRIVEATGRTFFENGEPVRIVGTVQDITERKETLLELKRSEEKLRMARDSNRMGSYEYSLQIENTQWDPLLKEIWGLPPEATPTQEDFWAGVHPEDREQVAKALEAAMIPSASKGHYHAIYRVVNRNTGYVSWVEASGQTIFRGDEPERIVGMVIDITEQKNLEQSLQQAVRALEETDEKKNQFLATLGHELRNPLSVISMGISVLQKDFSRADDFLESIASNARQIGHLLDDLLDLTRIARGKLNLVLEPLELRAFLGECVRDFEQNAAAKGQKLVLEVEKQALWVSADRYRMGQVISNLLNNAQKFSPEQSTIRLSLRSIRGMARIEVIDAGIGLEPATLESIFDPFEQVRINDVANTGLGIGLSLVKDLVEKHGGIVRALSDGPGKGSIFRIELPLSNEAAPTPPAPENASRRVRPGLRVMVVDDNVGAAFGLSALLEVEGCAVQVAHSAEEAHAKLEAFEAEAMLIDIGLGATNGCDLLREIRARQEGAESAVYLACTGYGHAEARAETKKAGFHHHLSKPPDLDELFSILGAL